MHLQIVDVCIYGYVCIHVYMYIIDLSILPNQVWRTTGRHKIELPYLTLGNPQIDNIHCHT